MKKRGIAKRLIKTVLIILAIIFVPYYTHLIPSVKKDINVQNALEKGDVVLVWINGLPYILGIGAALLFTSALFICLYNYIVHGRFGL